MYNYIHILLVLCLWRMLTNKDFDTKVVLKEQNFKDGFSELVLGFL